MRVKLGANKFPQMSKMTQHRGGATGLFAKTSERFTRRRFDYVMIQYTLLCYTILEHTITDRDWHLETLAADRLTQLGQTRIDQDRLGQTRVDQNRLGILPALAGTKRALNRRNVRPLVGSADPIPITTYTTLTLQIYRSQILLGVRTCRRVQSSVQLELSGTIHMDI